MAEKAGTTWDGIKNTLRKALGNEKPKDDEVPAGADGEPTNDDDEDEYEDATELVKSLTDKIEGLEGAVNAMAKATAAILDKMEESETLQKSLGQGIVALMDRTEQVIASPAPRKGAVTQLEANVSALMAKALGGGTASSSGSGTAGSMKPFTQERMDKAKDILTKAVSDGEIDIRECAKWETHMNKSMGMTAYEFPEEFAAFMKKKLSE